MSRRDRHRATEKLEREVTKLGVVTAGKLKTSHRQPRLGEVGASLPQSGDQQGEGVGGRGGPAVKGGGGGNMMMMMTGGNNGSLESVAFATSIDGGVAAGEKCRLLAKKRLLQEVLQPAGAAMDTLSSSPRPGASSRTTYTTGRNHHHHGGQSTRTTMSSRTAVGGGAVSAPLPTDDNMLQTPVPSSRLLAPLLPAVAGPGATTQTMFLSKLSQADVAASVKRSRSKVLPAMQDAASHSPATFMAEITVFVESELQHLERRFPRDPSRDLQGRVPPTSILPSEVALRRAGCAPPTQEESKRALRVGIFSNAQKMFADAFKTYKLFLDAIAEEHVTYASFLRDDLQLHKEVIAGMRQEMERVKEQARQDVAAAKQERDETFALVDSERNTHKKLRMQHQENQMMEKNQETDVKRQLNDLEQGNMDLTAENKRYRKEIESLKRQIDTLSLTTFSDALETANHQLVEWKATATAKEDLIYIAHDETAEVAKDLRRTTEHFHALLDYEEHLTIEDVKLSPIGLRTLFPEAAAARRRTIVAETKRQAKAATDRNREQLASNMAVTNNGTTSTASQQSSMATTLATPGRGNDPSSLTSSGVKKKVGAEHSLANFLPPPDAAVQKVLKVL